MSSKSNGLHDAICDSKGTTAIVFCGNYCNNSTQRECFTKAPAQSKQEFFLINLISRSICVKNPTREVKRIAWRGAQQAEARENIVCATLQRCKQFPAAPPDTVIDDVLATNKRTTPKQDTSNQKKPNNNYKILLYRDPNQIELWYGVSAMENLAYCDPSSQLSPMEELTALENKASEAHELHTTRMPFPRVAQKL